MRTLIDYRPFQPEADARPWRARGHWPFAWVAHPDATQTPIVAAYRLRFTLDAAARVRAHVSADERYELFLDGARIGRGSERGSPDLWFFETYDLDLAPGEHTLVAQVWSLGALGPEAQMSVRHGFLFAPEGDLGELLGTGRAAWEAKRLAGYTFIPPGAAKWRGYRVQVDGAAFDWGFERGDGDGWVPAVAVEQAIGRVHDWEIPPHHRLEPATLLPQVERPLQLGTVRLLAAAPSLETEGIAVRSADHDTQEAARWQALVEGRGSVTVPPRTTRRAIIDLGEYYCAYPELVTSGGAGGTVRVLWAESLRHTPSAWVHDKGHRDEIEGKYFVGYGDVFLPDGGAGRSFRPLWWMAGRYLEIVAQAADEPLVIERLRLVETRYPLEMESSFASDDRRLEEIAPILVRGLQMDAHETYADCPYYEELMYAGDTRLEILCTYVMTRDERLPRKALRLFDDSRRPSGLTQSRYPCRLMQIIAPFSLWWVGMVYDYALWRGDASVLAALMPGVRQTLEAFRRFIGPDGLLYAPEGWNTLDWVPAWEAGIPPGGVDGASGLMNWQLVYTLALAADLEARLGEDEQAARYRRQAAELAERATAAFWDAGRGLLADDLEHRAFSEHTQCMALLSGQLPEAMRAQVAAGLLSGAEMERTTIYFSHYLFETYRLLGRVDALFDRLELWHDLMRRGFRCPVESPEPSRSDCHAWGSHPLYHYFVTILGVRPADLGFRSVEVRPQLGHLRRASGRLVHPAGEIAVDLRVEGGELRGQITLPEGVRGTLHLGGDTLELSGTTTW